MANIIVDSSQDLEDVKKLVNRCIPTCRQAYSDRTSWIMACLSELAYLKFNKPFLDKKIKNLLI